MNTNEEKILYNIISRTTGKFRELVEAEPFRFKWLNNPIKRIHSEKLIIAKRIIENHKIISAFATDAVFCISCKDYKNLLLSDEYHIEGTIKLHMNFPNIPELEFQNDIIKDHISRINEPFFEIGFEDISIESDFNNMVNDISSNRVRDMATYFGAYEYYCSLSGDEIIKRIKTLEYVRKYQTKTMRVPDNFGKIICDLKMTYNVDLNMKDWANAI